MNDSVSESTTGSPSLGDVNERHVWREGSVVEAREASDEKGRAGATRRRGFDKGVCAW